ncbi:MAG: hypothetical protein Q3M24_16425 [Candidatus Electrothrix aestuarii]|uniref:Uncharacterized protein n=1 Tax=Candidatus Electrothrix aestuarii TaxID=3062594 RepID=A0AAU8LSR8_9BACT
MFSRYLSFFVSRPIGFFDGFFWGSVSVYIFFGMAAMCGYPGLDPSVFFISDSFYFHLLYGLLLTIVFLLDFFSDYRERRKAANRQTPVQVCFQFRILPDAFVVSESNFEHFDMMNPGFRDFVIVDVPVEVYHHIIEEYERFDRIHDFDEFAPDESVTISSKQQPISAGSAAR